MISLVPQLITSDRLSFTELCHCTRVSAITLIQLVEHDIAVPLKGDKPSEWFFACSIASTVNRATRLRRDLRLHWADIAMVMQLLQRIQGLEREKDQLAQRLARATQVVL